MTREEARAEAVELIARLRSRGWSLEQIASHPLIQCTRGSISSWSTGRHAPRKTHLAGLQELVDSKIVPADIRQGIVEDLRLLYREGWTIPYIAERLDMSKGTISRYLRGELLPLLKRQAKVKALVRELAAGVAERKTRRT